MNTEQYSIQISTTGDSLLYSVRVGILLINNLTLFYDNNMYFEFGYKNIDQNDTTWTYS
jgi:hypothetical protein